MWDDERALMDFVQAEPHLGAMRALRPHMAETKFVRWTVKGPQVPPSWEDAVRALRSR